MHSVTLCGFILSIGILYANVDGSPAGSSGAPGETSCSICHSGTVVNPSQGRVIISIPSSAGTTTYAPGRTLRLRVTVEDITATRWGFSLTVRGDASAANGGTLGIPSTSAAFIRLVTSTAANTSLTQTSTGSFRAQPTRASWDFDWTAPAAGAGTVRFYAAGLGANNDNTASGDRVYTSTLALTEAPAGPPPLIETGNTILPQFVFGGGWTSSIYFSNSASAQVAFPVTFFDDAAGALQVNGSAAQQVTIPARGALRILAANAGDLKQGWVTFDLPAGVTGYGVFRQSVPGIADQEAVVPFASATGPQASILFEDAGDLITAIALWFNGEANADVTISARDEAGAPLGTAAINMKPGNKSAFPLRDRIPGVVGKRGTVDFTVANGYVGVLGLRFAGSAFTSIPAAQ